MSSWVRGQEVPSTRAAETSSHSQGDYNSWTTTAGASGYQVGGDYSSAPPPSYANPYGSGTGDGGGYDTSKQKPMNYGYTTGMDVLILPFKQMIITCIYNEKLNSYKEHDILYIFVYQKL